VGDLLTFFPRSSLFSSVASYSSGSFGSDILFMKSIFSILNANRLNALFVRSSLALSCLTFSISAHAAGCSFPISVVCTKMTVIESKMKKYRAKAGDIFSFSADLCETTLREVVSGKKHLLRNKVCPKIPGGAYIRLNPACNDVGGVPPGEDGWEVLGSKECERSPEENLKRVRALMPKIKVVKSSYDLMKYGFTPIGVVLTKDRTHTQPAVMHSFPGVTLYFGSDACLQDGSCGPIGGGELIPHVGVLRRELVNETECKLWGGTPVMRAKSDQDRIQLYYELGNPISDCKFSEKPKLNRELLDGVASKK
jgi:hypothetical protein